MIKPTVTYYIGTHFEFGEIHYWNDIEHNLAGPSSIAYYKNGLRFHEDWKVLGKRHREDGLALSNHILPHDGPVFYDFYLHGIRYCFKEWVRRVEGRIDPEILEQLKRKHFYEW